MLLRKPFKEMIGKKVRLHRIKLGLSQDCLGENVGVSGRHIGSIERGEKLPNALTLTKLQLVLGFTLHDYREEFIAIKEKMEEYD